MDILLLMARPSSRPASRRWFLHPAGDTCLFRSTHPSWRRFDRGLHTDDLCAVWSLYMIKQSLCLNTVPLSPFPAFPRAAPASPWTTAPARHLLPPGDLAVMVFTRMLLHSYNPVTYTSSPSALPAFPAAGTAPPPRTFTCFTDTRPCLAIPVFTFTVFNHDFTQSEVTFLRPPLHNPAPIRLQPPALL
ncbi:hypothetical protein B0H16DRAFT_1856385 [Mycena metata]|uniref:Uncharacterized protein n=1 Tax=Mycena metata TaxID=1033252 RepID=A0AAD7N4M8_9AGAR|nr:hypothetical protein B0H16DRAFT_1856385 [Mycena metata]